MTLREQLTEEVRRVVLNEIIDEFTQEAMEALRARITVELVRERLEDERAKLRAEILQEYYDEKSEAIRSKVDDTLEPIIADIKTMGENQLGFILSQLRIRATNVVEEEMFKFKTAMESQIKESTILLQKHFDTQLKGVFDGQIQPLLEKAIKDALNH